jgi:deoxyribodipyrimidine photolyase-related protein
MWSKKQLKIIPNVKSKDKENRNKMPNDIKIPKIPSNNSDEKYITKGVEFVKKYFDKNNGNTSNFMFPLTHATAKQWLVFFIKSKAENFGDYQDAISQKNNTLFHSLLSTSINIGLLQPKDVIDEILKNKKNISMNSLEGFIRQLFWREYQRYCYEYYNFNNKNYFGNNKKLDKNWYNGTTGILPIDNCIKIGFDTGYLHHIERLMIIGNSMNLYGIHPNEGFKWFMEFSCDSYLWVMHQNVYDMVFFVSGGKTMRRPYISSSNYILKMSDYKKDNWCDEWDKLYNDFLKKNKDKLMKFRYYFRGLKDV